jgi:NADH-quinone oxidoreductase subunit M
VLLPYGTQVWLFLAFALAFAIKVPMFPFHTWLPDAHVQAPTGGSVILAAVLLKLGTYGFLRFAMPLFPLASHHLAPLVFVPLSVVAILYGAYCAWVQKDVKKLVAYSSVSHMGFVMMGVFAMTDHGISGAVLQMLNHGVSTGALFILVGVIYERRHTRDLDAFGGLAKTMPWYALLFVIVTMSSVGLPGTNGFIGEFMILTGTYASESLEDGARPFALLGALGVIFAAVYMLHAVLKMFWGPLDKKENEGLPDVTGREALSLAPLMVLIFWVGLFPSTFLDPMKGSVSQFMLDYEGKKRHTARLEEPQLAPSARVEAQEMAAALAPGAVDSDSRGGTR